MVLGRGDRPSDEALDCGVPCLAGECLACAVQTCEIVGYLANKNNPSLGPCSRTMPRALWCYLSVRYPCRGGNACVFARYSAPGAVCKVSELCGGERERQRVRGGERVQGYLAHKKPRPLKSVH